LEKLFGIEVTPSAAQVSCKGINRLNRAVSQLLEETDPSCFQRQEKVAKIVHGGEQDKTKAAGIVTGGLFSFPSRVCIAS